MMPEVAKAEADATEEVILLLAGSLLATMRPQRARRWLAELEKRAALQESLCSAAPLRSSTAAQLRAAKREAAGTVLALLPLLASCVPPG